MSFKIMTVSAAISVLLMGCGQDEANQEAEEAVEIQAEVAAETVAVDYAALMAAEDRSDEDKARDAGRHPAEVLALLGVEPGQMYLDLGAGSGYYSEVLARAAGPTGMVHAVNNPGTVERFPQVVDGITARAEGLTVVRIFAEVTEYADVTAHKPADGVFFGQMYHEVIRQNMDAAAINAAVFNALKPGGLYVIEIHNAAAGAGREVSDTFHRADPDIVRAEVLAAGFELVEENTTLLGNPDDPLDVMVFDPSVRGNTSRTLFIFRKPNSE